MDAVIQLIRNALCCVKSLGIYSNTVLYDPSYTARYYKFPPPLDQTTPLEVLISVTQLYAVITVTTSGLSLLVNDGIKKYSYLKRVLSRFSSSDTKNEARDYIQQCLRNDYAMAERNILCGFCVMSIGISFVWLFANSYHVTATDWIGGLAGLIHALEVMEAGLVVLLYFMLADALEKRDKAIRIAKRDIELEWYAAAEEDWSPFWRAATSKDDDAAIDKQIEQEIQSMKTIQSQMKKQDYSKSLSDNLLLLSQRSRKEAFCNYLYFLLNFLAFWGYLVAILCYYFPRDDEDPQYIRYMKFGMETYSADWWGNFVGDFSWTVEPVVILASPWYLSSPASSSDTETKKKKE